MPAPPHQCGRRRTGGGDLAQRRLDALIAEAERSNDDLAGAVARVQEADAQVRIAGAPLLPSLDAGATATRERGQVSGVGAAGVQCLQSGVDRQLRTGFLGQEPRAARRRARRRGRQPLRSANRRADGHQQRRDHVFPGARAARPHRGGAAESRERTQDPQRVQGRAIRRHGDRPRCGAARNRGGAVERRAAAAAAAVSPDRVCAGGAGRQDARIGRRRRGHADGSAEPRRGRRGCPRSCCRAGPMWPRRSSN